MKLGNDIIGVRQRVPRVDGSGNPVRSPIGAPIVDVVDVKVHWCQVVPSMRRKQDNEEQEDRAAPRISGVDVYAPAGTQVTAADVVVWPIQSEATVGGVLQLTGPVYQVIGDPGPWGESLEIRLRKSS